MGFNAIFNQFSSNIIQTSVEMLFDFVIITSPLLTLNVSSMMTLNVSSMVTLRVNSPIA
jgi:hypothetical protein